MTQPMTVPPTAVAAAPPVPLNTMVEQYIKMRDALAAFKKTYEEKKAPVEAAMERIEAELLRQFNTLGIDSAGSSEGTAYKSTRSSCTVADWDATLGYIQQHGLWHMLEHRVSKKAVEEFKTANNDLPPGLNWREEVTINIRRS